MIAGFVFLTALAVASNLDPGFPQWLSTGGSLALAMMAVVSFLKGFVVPRWAYNAMLAAKDAEIAERKVAFDQMAAACAHAQAANRLLMKGATISMDVVKALHTAVDSVGGE